MERALEMVVPLLVTLREGVEVALILGIVLAYLARTGNKNRIPLVWAGAAAATGVSLLAGLAINFTVGELQGTAEQLFEGSVMLLAVAMLTYMVVWMRHQASGIRSELQERAGASLGSGSRLAIALMAFLVVVREGIETALFFFASTRSSTPIESTVGGLFGLVLATAIGYSVYRGSRRVNLRVFFDVTGVLLIVFAAGLLSHGIGEYQEAGLLPEVVEHVWDVNWLLDEQTTLGRFLTAVAGYNASPSLLEALAYLGYLVTSLAYFFGSARPAANDTSHKPRRAA